MGSELVELFIVSKFLNIFDSIGLIYHRGMFQFLQDRRTSICSQFTSAATVEVPPDNQLLTTVRMRQLNDRDAGAGGGGCGGGGGGREGGGGPGGGGAGWGCPRSCWQHGFISNRNI